MAQFLDMYDVDLQKPTAPQPLRQVVGVGDNAGNRIGAYVYSDGAPVSLSGACTGFVIRADGETVPLTGTISGNAAYVVLDQASCAVEGPIQVAVCWVSGANVTTLLIGYGSAIPTATGAVIQPSTPLPDLTQLLAEINNMRQATAAATAAAEGALDNFAGAFDETQAYPAGAYVTYTDGKLYELTRGHTANTAWTDTARVRVTTGERMQAFDAGLYNAPLLESGMWADAATSPTKTTNTNKIRNAAPIPIDLYGSISLPTGYKCYALVYSAAGEWIGYFGYNQGNLSTEIRADAIVEQYSAAAQYMINISKTDTASGDISAYLPELRAGLVARISSNYIDGALGRYRIMITTEAKLNALTGNTKSLDDFPVGRTVTIGQSGLGVVNAPSGFSTGVVVTFDGRGAQTTSNGTMQLVVGSNGAYTRWCVGGAWTAWKIYATDADLAALSAKTLQGYAQYNSRADWLAAFPSDNLGDIPVNRVIMIGSSSIAPSDQPTAGFYGNVLTLTARDSLKPGAMQFAWNGNDRNRMFNRNYIYASAGNYWSAWSAVEFAPEEYHVGSGQAYTSITTLLLDLKGNQRQKIIYIHAGEYDIFAEYLTEVAAERITVPPDNISSGTYFEPYNAFVPNNTRIVGLGNVTLKMEPTVAQLEALDSTAGQTGFGAAATWSPLNIYGSVEIENITVRAHNARYCMHNDDHNQFPNALQHYKRCRFLFTLSDRDAQDRRLGFNNAIGFGIQDGATHIYDSCEFYVDTTGQHSAFYGHEGSAYKNGIILVRNCVIHSSNFSDPRVVKLQSLATTAGRVQTRFENCYINGGLCLDLYNTESKQNFDTTLVGCNRVPVSRINSSGGAIVDPYTVTWYNPLPAPTAQDPQIDTDSYNA